MSITKETIKQFVYWLILIFLILSLSISIIGIILLLTFINELFALSIVVSCIIGYLIGYISIIKDN